jgi:hypothetical protein
MYYLFYYRSCVPVVLVKLVNTCQPVPQVDKLEKCPKVHNFFVDLLMTHSCPQAIPTFIRLDLDMSYRHDRGDSMIKYDQ